MQILEILAELPITNRNTITKSQVLDVVAEWAKIPQDVKIKIERFQKLYINFNLFGRILLCSITFYLLEYNVRNVFVYYDIFLTFIG